ncbi:hypothetical protein QNZ73_004760 [Vibrio parahaemolyticus]|nr:hypothetical protein [Vibrio parahaemolyticus]ELB2100232.1 hypothetical protein [Vibrio parahaemolyticus]ELB2209957.1 hypothetical protein [Vibrio parahaemolyticus]ELB2291828.1 hypothetical protein [Vibrio parahaemolyticus]
MSRASKEFSLYQSYSIAENKEFHNTFLQATFEIESLSEAKLIDRQLQTQMNRLLYSNVITALETYLSDALFNIVMSNPDLIRKVVETSPEFKNQKFDLSEIYNKYSNLESLVAEYLVNIIYHNLSKVSQIYRSVLGVEFPKKLSAIYKAITIRHDIIHRNGKDKNGQPIILEKADVHQLLSDIRTFVAEVNVQIPPLVSEVENA